MANHKSSVKRAKQDLKKKENNRSNESAAKTAVKKVREAIASGDKNTAQELLKSAQSSLRKLAKTGVLKLGSAARKTSRLASQVNKL